MSVGPGMDSFLVLKAMVGVAAGKLAVLPEDSSKAFEANNKIEPRPIVGLGRSPRWGVLVKV